LKPVRVAFDVRDEAAFASLARAVARCWKSELTGSLLVGLCGDLGAGKTTWVRAMLAGLGYGGRVPSPTYTLLEHYSVDCLDVVHADLYRLGGRDRAGGDASAELESLGLREWLAKERCWLLVEWPERAASLERGMDLRIEITATADEARHIEIVLLSAVADGLVEGLRGIYESTSS
jgi:tRNA threonylcarbamoyladenosine biosynthesis protein TsaE